MKSFFFLLVVFLFLPISFVFAQTSQETLATVNYNKPADLSYLFSHSSRELIYLEGDDVPEAVFIGLFTPQQLTTIKDKHLQVTVIDKHPDLTHYALLWHPQADKASLLKQYGETFVISPNYTLLKTDASQPYVDQGTTEQFIQVPFSTVPIATPLPREQVDTYSPSSPTITPIATVKKKSEPSFIPILLFLILLVSVGIGSYVYWKKKSQQQPQV